MAFRLIAFRVLSLAALAVCAAMVVDLLRPTPAFCGFRAGCEDVMQSPCGRPLGVPLPVVGLAAFGLFFALTLFPASRAGRLVGPLALVAGAIGLALVAIQMLVLHRTCPLCLMVDTAAILLAAVELALPQPFEAPVPTRPRRWAWGGVAILAGLAPVAWSVLKPPPAVPPQVRAYWSEGRTTVVEITDFACPYCRQTHAALDRFLEQHAGQVRFVRLVVPLDHYEHSRPAARAWLCAVRQGRGEAMADALFQADDLSPPAVRMLAERVGLNLDEYDACIADSALDEQLAETTTWVKEADLGGLPQVWVQDVLLVGLQTPESLRAALSRVERAAGK